MGTYRHPDTFSRDFWRPITPHSLKNQLKTYAYQVLPEFFTINMTPHDAILDIRVAYYSLLQAFINDPIYRTPRDWRRLWDQHMAPTLRRITPDEQNFLEQKFESCIHSAYIIDALAGVENTSFFAQKQGSFQDGFEGEFTHPEFGRVRWLVEHDHDAGQFLAGAIAQKRIDWYRPVFGFDIHHTAHWVPLDQLFWWENWVDFYQYFRAQNYWLDDMSSPLLIDGIENMFEYH
jgi:hypothetical protein